MSAEQNRQPAGVPTGGQFTTSTRAESGVALPAPPDEAYKATVTVVANVDLDARWHDPLPQWPAGVPEPELYWEYKDGMVQTTFTFPSGDTVRCWNVNDEGYSSLLDQGAKVGELADDDEAEDQALEWMNEVHDRVEAGAYGAAVATQTPGLRAAVAAYAKGEPQPTFARTRVVAATARARAMVEAFGPKSAGLDPNTHERDRGPVLRDMLTDLQYLASEWGVDFDELVSGAKDVYDEERGEANAVVD